MKTQAYTKLAVTGIVKNKKLYFPYIISCVGAVAMQYIIEYLSVSETVESIRGGSNLTMILSMGKFVITAFAAIFLFYTNSFLIRRRNREFGLYNVLGMDKKGISRIIIDESALVALISISAGLITGIILSKLAELWLLYIVKAEAGYTLSVSLKSVGYVILIFAGIFVLLTVKSVIQVSRSGALELLGSESFGEKPIKANRFFAVLGAVILLAAYAIAVLIKNPLSAILGFLIAVIMVIIATYLLFMSGSVALCKLLQKNKKYYYKKNHFISVSTMAYRMKRNGAGLASICILSTMVLVMLASSASLYFGAEDSISARFPEENYFSVYSGHGGVLSDDEISVLRGECEKVFSENGITPEKVTEYSYAGIVGCYSEGDIDPDPANHINDLLITNSLRAVYFMGLDDYNKIMGTDIILNSGEAMVTTLRCSYNKPVFSMGGAEFTIKGELDAYPSLGDSNVSATPSVLLLIPDLAELEPLEKLADFNGDKMLSTRWYYGYNLDESDEICSAVFAEILNRFTSTKLYADESITFDSDCLAVEKSDFYTTFGGLFFIGIILSVIFIFAEAMIIYYKQISEGYEDRARFEIMQKVGMTKSDIRKSINSQTLTVFFAPLIMAGIHLCFAFPPIWKLLQLFNLRNLPFVILVTGIAFVLFGIFYAVIYKITTRAYYSIVVSADKE